jgi:hypothetical protein
MITSEIGWNAGKIWNLLNEQGEHSITDLKDKLNLDDHEFYMAIGWLAREGKIFHVEKDEKLMLTIHQSLFFSF